MRKVISKRAALFWDTFTDSPMDSYTNSTVVDNHWYI
jgi:hypothetical protein